jgi:hypothetical protein
MKVAFVYAEGRSLVINSERNNFHSQKLRLCSELIAESIKYNCTDARIEIDDLDSQYKPLGNQVDCCLMEFLQESGISYME